MRATNDTKNKKNVGAPAHRCPNKGITLIALIITIIVMLILVAVTINMAVNGGLFENAGQSVKETTIAHEKEKIQMGLTKIIIEKAVSDGDFTVTKEALESALATGTDNISVSDKRPGDEYPYIVTFNGNQYGIKENNEVEYLEAGIYNKYIYVTYVNEEAPTYSFKNVITQEDVDVEANATNTPYSIIGVATSEDGEYISSGNVEGKSGYLSIVDLQKADFEYTLNKFFKGDEVFYVKIQIGNNIEKIQKLAVIQGDIVKYEENFIGIEYIGTWHDIEDENCSAGRAKYTDVVGSDVSFVCLGNAFDIATIRNERSRANEYFNTR